MSKSCRCISLVLPLIILGLRPASAAPSHPDQFWNYVDPLGTQIPFRFGIDSNRAYNLTFPSGVTSPQQAEVLALPQFNNQGYSGQAPIVATGALFPASAGIQGTLTEATQAQQIAGTAHLPVVSTPASIASAASLIGPSLLFTPGTPGTLNTIQGIRTQDSPTFNNLVLGNGNPNYTIGDSNSNNVLTVDVSGNVRLQDSNNTEILTFSNTGGFFSIIDNNSNGFSTQTGVVAITSAGIVTSNQGLISTSPASGVGYTTGAGGTVTQGAGSGRSTAVTLNKVTGTITGNNTSLAAQTAVTFTVNDTSCAATDVPVLAVKSGAPVTTIFHVSAVAASSFNVTEFNENTVTADTSVPVLSFVIVKGSAN